MQNLQKVKTCFSSANIYFCCIEYAFHKKHAMFHQLVSSNVKDSSTAVI